MHAQSSDVTIAPEDLVVVTVEGQPDLSGQYAVESNGSFLFPLVGRVEAEGLTAQALTDVLAGRLDAYVKDPRLGVEVRPPERVFVFGDVQQPGFYDLTKGLTIVELLSQAGSSQVSEVSRWIRRTSPEDASARKRSFWFWSRLSCWMTRLLPSSHSMRAM